MTSCTKSDTHTHTLSGSRESPDLDQQVRVEDHQVGGHLSGDFNLLGLQLSVHAEQHIVGVPVVSWEEKHKTQNAIWD